MTDTLTAPERIFSQVLLEKLTSPGAIFNALPSHPPEDILFAVAGIAFGRWLQENRLEETDQLFHIFLNTLEKKKKQALRVIQTQVMLTLHGAPVQ